MVQVVGVEGYTGLPRSGKTLRLAQIGLRDIANGRDVYANFGLGDRVYGYAVPICPFWGGICGGGFGTVHSGHIPDDATFEPRSAALDARAALCEWRKGFGFVKYPGMTVLDDWKQVVALRVARDVFGDAHRLVLERGPDIVLADGEVEQSWSAVPTCKWFRCSGCSKGITVLLDELNGWAPARFFQQMDIGTMNRWSYSGKDGLEIYWSAQHQSFVDKYVREVTNFVWVCHKMGPTSISGQFVRLFGVPLVLFQRHKWHAALLTDVAGTNVADDEKMTARKPITSETATWWWSLGAVSQHYDTYERVKQMDIKHRGAVRRLKTA
jgi:hypothetical protein